MKVTYEDEIIPYTIESTYRPDYRVSLRRNDETFAYVEFKGGGRAFDSNVRKKMIAVKNQHPDKVIYLVFYRDGKVGATRKDGTFLKQSDWSIKNGFEFCIGVESIPDYWFDPDYKGQNKIKTLKDQLREDELEEDNDESD